MRRIFILLLCIFLLTTGVFAADSEIAALKTDAIVAQDGTCRITVTAEISFSGATQTLLLPLGEDATDVSLAGYSYRTRAYNGVTCLIVTSDAGFSGKQSFTFSYALPCAVTEQLGSQLFTLHLIPYGWEYAIKQYEVTVAFPSEVTAQPTWTSGYYNDIIDNYLDIQVDGNTVTAQSNTPMRDRETLTMALKFADSPFDLRNLPGKTVPVVRIAFYILLLLALGYWFFLLRNPLPHSVRQTTADMEAGAGELPCQLFGEAPDTAACLAHWANLGYLTVSRNSRGRVILHKQMEMGNERKLAERKLFYAVFRKGDTCDGAELPTRLGTAGGALQLIWLRRMFAKNSGSPQVLRIVALFAGLCAGWVVFDALLPAVGIRWFLLPLLAVLFAAVCLPIQQAPAALYHRRRAGWLIAALFACAAWIAVGAAAGWGGTALINVLLQLLCGAAVIFGGKRSREGQEQVRRLLGLRSYLRSAPPEELQAACHRDPQYFYRMLPYADVLGVGRAFAKRLGCWKPDACPWLDAEGESPSDATEFCLLYMEIMAVIRGESFRRFTDYDRRVRAAARTGTEEP